MFADFEAELYKASRLTETVKRLEKAKSDAVGETARVKAEVGMNVWICCSSTNDVPV